MSGMHTSNIVFFSKMVNAHIITRCNILIFFGLLLWLLLSAETIISLYHAMGEENKRHVCPVWIGHLLVNPIRVLGQNPDKITGPYLKPGMKVLDFGCGMGYFSIPMAKRVGENGSVYCADIQEKMLTGLMKRAERINVHAVIKPVLIKEVATYAGLPDQLDFVLLFAVMHEVPDKEKLFRVISECMKAGGKVLFAEPSGHVSASQFSDSLQFAENSGLKKMQRLTIFRSHAMLLCKNGKQHLSPI